MSEYISTLSFTECRNVLFMLDGTIAPRSETNLKKLLRYAKRKYKLSPYDKRTKAYKFMLAHDSEWRRRKNNG